MKSETAFKMALVMDVFAIIASVGVMILGFVLGLLLNVTIVGIPFGMVLWVFVFGLALLTLLFAVILFFAWKRSRLAVYLLVAFWIVSAFGSLIYILTIILIPVTIFCIVAAIVHLRAIEAVNPEICKTAPIICEKKPKTPE